LGRKNGKGIVWSDAVGSVAPIGSGKSRGNHEGEKARERLSLGSLRS